MNKTSDATKAAMLMTNTSILKWGIENVVFKEPCPYHGIANSKFTFTTLLLRNDDVINSLQGITRVVDKRVITLSLYFDQGSNSFHNDDWKSYEYRTILNDGDLQNHWNTLSKNGVTDLVLDWEFKHINNIAPIDPYSDYDHSINLGAWLPNTVQRLHLKRSVYDTIPLSFHIDDEHNHQYCISEYFCLAKFTRMGKLSYIRVSKNNINVDNYLDCSLLEFRKIKKQVYCWGAKTIDLGISDIYTSVISDFPDLEELTTVITPDFKDYNKFKLFEMDHIFPVMTILTLIYDPSVKEKIPINLGVFPNLKTLIIVLNEHIKEHDELKVRYPHFKVRIMK